MKTLLIKFCIKFRHFIMSECYYCHSVIDWDDECPHFKEEKRLNP